MKNCLICFLLIITTSVYAEVKKYELTDNAGLTRLERMDGVEKQLIALTNALNNLESKLLDNSKKMKDFEDIIRAIKQEESKKISAQLGEKNENSADEMKKLKADFLTIKNKDIEKIKLDIHDLNEAIKQIHGTTH